MQEKSVLRKLSFEGVELLMAIAQEPQKVKLTIGFIAGKEFLDAAVRLVKRKFGGMDFQSDVLEFEHTDYYFEEMGRPLYRQFISFRKLIFPSELWKIKKWTNKLEMKFKKDGRRQVNIDPGYLNFSRLVLASAKDFSHRIYLNKGIFAEITLLFRDGEYRTLPWTFPDYSTETYRDIFKQIRMIYAGQINKRKNID